MIKVGLPGVGCDTVSEAIHAHGSRMTAALGRSLELFYVDGHPDGMVTAELFNWTGHVLTFPRTRLGEALARSEAGYAGVYILFGQREEKAASYIGESEDIGARIRQHDVRKDWWTSAVLVTASANKLNKAHVRYLEARLIEHAKAIGRVPLDNLTHPVLPLLSEADQAKMETFLENLLVVLPAVRVDMFIQRTRKVRAFTLVERAEIGDESERSSGSCAKFKLETPKHGLHASALLIDGEFVVEAGSLAKHDWTGPADHNYAPLYHELRRSGVLVREGSFCVFKLDYAFKSPSAAAAVINGRPANGPQAWRTASGGMTYHDWETLQFSAGGTKPA